MSSMKGTRGNIVWSEVLIGDVNEQVRNITKIII